MPPLTAAPAVTTVAHLIGTLEVGGAEMMLAKLVARSDRPTVRHVVLCLGEDEPLGTVIRQAGVTLHCLRAGGRRYLPRTLVEIRRLLRRERVDVLQTWLYYADAIGLMLRSLGSVRRLAWNIRCSDTSAAYRTRLHRAMLSALARASGIPDAVVVNSRDGQQIHERLGYRPRRWVLLPNGFDLGHFRPDPQAGAAARAAWGIPAAAPVVGLVARLHPLKDHPTFLAAAARALRRRPDMRFVIVGDGPPAYRASLQDRAAQLGIAPAVVWAGTRDDMPAVYNAFTVATLTSIAEGFPNVVGEAMACGVPCVVTPAGDAAGLVGDTGRIVAVGDADGMATGWLDLVDAVAATPAIAEAARRRIGASFDLGRIAASYDDLYEELARPR